MKNSLDASYPVRLTDRSKSLTDNYYGSNELRKNVRPHGNALLDENVSPNDPLI